MMANNPTSLDQDASTRSPPQAGGLWRRLVQLGRSVFIIFLILILLLMWFETSLIFPTWQIPPGNFNPDGLAFEQAFFHADDGTRLCGWYFEHPEPLAQVLYCHGNGEHLGHMGDLIDALRREYRISIFAFDYRGYGKSEGKPDEPGIMADGRAARLWLAQRAQVPPTKVVLWGRSIGGAVAVRLAADLDARAMILERTFTNMPDVAAHHYKWLPVRYLVRNRFDSQSSIGAYSGPLLQSHGTADEVIPFSLGKQLFESATSAKKRLVVMPGVSHNGPDTHEYHSQLHRFLEGLP
jgi:uncharacterized protein